jgi:putative efflux protein, MATE family
MNKNSREEKLRNGKIPSLLFEFSIPAIIGMLVNAIYNIVDRIFIGNVPDLGAAGIAGITVTFPITLILIALSLMAGAGGATRFSISLGQRDEKAAAKYLGNAFILTTFFGLCFTILGNIFLEPILKSLGASQNVLPYAKEYLSIILFGAVFQCISMVGNNFSRAQGNPKNAMISQLIGAGFNIVFDYILIIHFEMGMSGAALATIGGQFLSMIWQLSFLFGKRTIIKITFKNMLPDFKYLLSIISTGTPAFFMQMGNSILNIVLIASLSKHGGDIAITTIGIVTSIQTLIFMPITGLTQGQQPIISFNYGAKQMNRAKEAVKYTALTATTIATIGFLLIQFFPEAIVSMFNKDVEVIQLSKQAIRIWFLFLPLIGSQIVCAQYFQAVGQVKKASILNLSRQLIILIPCIFIFSWLFGLYGIFFAVPVSDIVSFILTVLIAFKKEIKTLKNTEYKSII